MAVPCNRPWMPTAPIMNPLLPVAVAMKALPAHKPMDQPEEGLANHAEDMPDGRRRQSRQFGPDFWTAKLCKTLYYRSSGERQQTGHCWTAAGGPSVLSLQQSAVLSELDGRWLHARANTGSAGYAECRAVQHDEPASSGWRRPTPENHPG